MPSQEIDTSEGLQSNRDNTTTASQMGNNFLTYFNPTYGVQIGYPQNWNVTKYPNGDIAYIFPRSENEITLKLGAERLPHQEIALDDYLDSRLDFSTPFSGLVIQLLCSLYRLVFLPPWVSILVLLD